MDREIALQFFQAAATVLPSIFVAFALTSHFLDPGSREKQRIQFILLSGTSGIITLAVVITGFIAAELMALIALATNTPTFPVFVMVLSYIFLFAWIVGLQALNPMFQDAILTAQQDAADEDTKARVVNKYRKLGNVIIVGSFLFLVGGAVAFYALRPQG
jgi:hypothetical protein